MGKRAQQNCDFELFFQNFACGAEIGQNFFGVFGELGKSIWSTYKKIDKFFLKSAPPLEKTLDSPMHEISYSFLFTRQNGRWFFILN